jgi:hypothetical protein
MRRRMRAICRPKAEHRARSVEASASKTKRGHTGLAGVPSRVGRGGPLEAQPRRPRMRGPLGPAKPS